MKLILILVVLIITSCNKDCPDKRYSLHLGLDNNTKFEMDISLYPKHEFRKSEGLYSFSSVGGGYGETNFTIDPDSGYNLGSFKYVIYTTNDTAISPSNLLTSIFDSILYVVDDIVPFVIRFSPDTVINCLENPYKNDSIWKFAIINSDTPDNSCENPGETKAFRFYIDQDMINK